MICRSGKVSKERITSIEPVLDILPGVVSQMNLLLYHNLFVFGIVFFRIQGLRYVKPVIFDPIIKEHLWMLERQSNPDFV